MTENSDQKDEKQVSLEHIHHMYRKLLVNSHVFASTRMLIERAETEIVPVLRPLVESFIKTSPQAATVEDLQKYLNKVNKNGGLYIPSQTIIRDLISPSNPIPMDDPEEFFNWVHKEYTDKINHPALQHHAAVSSIKSQHEIEFEQLKRLRSNLFEQIKLTPEYQSFSSLMEREKKISAAISNMAAQVTRAATDDKRDKLSALVEAKTAELAELQELKSQLLAANPQIEAYLKAVKDVEQFSAQVGLTSATEKLREVHVDLGHSGNTAGVSFEEACDTFAQALAAEYYASPEEVDLLLNQYDKSPIRILHSVTLAMAKAELDFVIVRGEPCSEIPSVYQKTTFRLKEFSKVYRAQVLAVIECKSSVSDIYPNIPKMQETISWLTGNTQKFDPKAWKTNYFTSGMFEKNAYFKKDSEVWLFDQNSFSQFVPNADGNYVDHIYYFSRRGRMNVPVSLVIQFLSGLLRDGVNFDDFDTPANRQLVEALRNDANFRALVQEKVNYHLALSVGQIPVIRLQHYSLLRYFSDLLPPDQQAILDTLND